MTVEQESLTPLRPEQRLVGSAIGRHPLQQAASRLSDFRDGRSRLRAKDLVGLLLCHGARAWRSSQPRSHVRLRVSAPHGTMAVRIGFGSPRS